MSAFLRSRFANALLALGERTPLRRLLTSTVIDPRSGLSIGSGDMGRDWDERARRNARFFVAGYDWESEESFARSGERDLETVILKGLDLPPDAVVLEIGCGLGRLLRPIGGRFREAHGVDISSEMVQRATEELKDCPNVHIHHTDGGLGQVPAAYFDFCFSYNVFQHISEKAAVLRYVQAAAAVLKPGGLFRFQVCQGEANSPRSRAGGTWLGVVFTKAELQQALPAYGFTILVMEEEETPADARRWDSLVVTCRRNAEE